MSSRGRSLFAATWLSMAVLSATLSSGTVEAQEVPAFPSWPAQLQTDVLNIARSTRGEIALYVKDIQSGVLYTYNSATPTYIASGIKLLVMVTVFDQFNRGKLSLETEVEFRDEDQRDGSPVLSYLRPGSKMSVRGLLRAMIQQSDNAASDILIREVGVDQINRTVREVGLDNFGPITSLLDVRRLVYLQLDSRAERLTEQDLFLLGMARPLESRVMLLADLLDEPIGTFTVADYADAYRRYYGLGYNTAPLDAMGHLLEKLLKGEVLNAESSQEMVDIMLGTQTGRRRLRGGFPPGTRFAHKTGTQYHRLGDFGILYLPGDRPVVVAMTLKNAKNRRMGEGLMARVGAAVYRNLWARPRDDKSTGWAAQVPESESASSVDLPKSRPR
jgi:beta-lactamase class A